MLTIEELFKTPTDVHPRLSAWKARLDQHGTNAVVEVFRDASGFGQASTELSLRFTEDGIEQPLETVPWDDDLNVGLIQLGVRAASPDQESERCSLGLRAATRNMERVYGDGYYNAVLVDLITASDLTRYPSIEEVLKYAYTNRPKLEERDRSKYHTCRDEIAYAIAGRARELKESLKYPQEESVPILANALARYLDDRFSISKRRRAGLT